MKSLPGWFAPLFFIILVGAVIGLGGHFAKAPKRYLEGSLVLDPSVETQAHLLRTVFIVLYPAATVQGGMPLGVVRLPLSGPPRGEFLHFVIDESNLQMMDQGAGGLPSTLRVKVRLDSLGQGGPDKPGDITGEVQNVELGAQRVQVRLHHVVP